MKFIKKSLSVLLALTIIFNLMPTSVLATGNAANNVDTHAVTQAEVNSIIADISATAEYQNVYDDEWRVIELIALGNEDQINKPEFIKFIQSQLDVPKKGYHNDVKGMEKATIALTLLGVDATKFTLTDGTVFNLVDAISNKPANSFGDRDLIDIAGEAFALSAYDSGDYKLNPSDFFTREKIIRDILKRQKSDGDMGGVDFTAMAVTSLSEYYTINPDVRVTVDKAVNWLSSVQEPDGSFSNYGSNSNSTSIVIVALSSLGIDAGTDARFIKNGNSALDGLLKFKLANNTFGFKNNTKYNSLATEQALRAFITYKEVLNTNKPYNIYKKQISSPPSGGGTNPPSSGGSTGGGGSGGTTNPTKEITVSLEIRGYNKTILATTNTNVLEQSSAWVAMKKIMDNINIKYINRTGNYISSIDGLAEFDMGSKSGWMYSINGIRPDVGVDDYVLSDKDDIKLIYVTGASSDSNTPNVDDKVENINPENKKDDVIQLVKFNDIKGFEWAEKEINVLVEKGIIKGTADGSFQPEKPTKRADFVIMLSRALELDTKVTTNFKDVSKDKYYYNEIGMFKELGIINGSGDNFNPEANISREDMFVITERALEKTKKIKATESKDTNISFTDDSEVSSYAKGAIDKLVDMGLVKGSHGKINPKNNATRAETAVFISRIIAE